VGVGAPRARTVVLGAGVTGLAAGIASCGLVAEGLPLPGGICRSYYVRPGKNKAMARCPPDGEAYRFEVGGGHWIFGGDRAAIRLLRGFCTLKTYRRRAGVYFADRGLAVPYPLQDHLDALEDDLARAARTEMKRSSTGGGRTMSEWLERRFGPALNELFFAPFHDRYTAGLYTAVAPQDSYKSPRAPRLLSASAPEPPGYNSTFVYPVEGLGALAGRMAASCNVVFDKRAVAVDVCEKEITFADGTRLRYENLISTLPLNRMLELTGTRTRARPDPYTSALVLNIGATRGPACPDHHWLYVPDSSSGLHRVGIYSNVDETFLPASSQPGGDRVAMYVERALRGGEKPTKADVAAYKRQVVAELQRWGFVDRVDSLHATWIDVAYTWSWPGSNWRTEALETLAARGIRQTGRFARWTFQGIAASIREGLAAGAA
jgi:protoporphyrinogen oxidase